MICTFAQECTDFRIESDLCSDNALATQHCPKCKLLNSEVYVESEPSILTPIGWYKIVDEWFLTKDALKKELHLTEKELSGIITEHKGKLRVVVRTNPHNNKTFIVYSLDDLRALVKTKPKPFVGFFTIF